ncbi:MAG TPA: IclR family transcriptional regulator [Eoetvoesiella sp.]
MRAINRVFSILDAFTADRTKLALQEISDRIQLSKATTFRLVNSLCDAGYLVKLEDQKYCLSMKLVKLAGIVASGLGVRDMAHPKMMEIGNKTGETVSLNAVVGTDRVCIDVVEAESRLMHIVNLGEHAPLFYGATGKVLLAHLPPDEQSAIVNALPPGLSMGIPGLKAKLAQIRKHYYAITESERVPEALAISVALFDMNNKGMYALTLTGPEERMRVQQERNLALMLQAQKEISLKMGASLFSAAA